MKPKTKSPTPSMKAKSVTSIIKDSSFAIFIIAVLIGGMGVVVWFNNIATEAISDQGNTTAEASSLGEGITSQPLNAKTVEELRSLQPAQNIHTAPPLEVEGRVNPFSD